MSLNYMKRLINFKKYLGIILVALLSLVPLIWFWGKDGKIINGVDTNFPLDPLVWIGRRFYVWNNIGNGGSDFSSSVAGIFFHLIQTIPFTFVVLYAFNIYLFNTWENVKVANLALVGAIPFALSTTILFWENRITYLKTILYS